MAFHGDYTPRTMFPNLNIPEFLKSGSGTGFRP